MSEGTEGDTKSEDGVSRLSGDTFNFADPNEENSLEAFELEPVRVTSYCLNNS